MFNKKPRRNFRQRKGESSDDDKEEEHKNGDRSGNNNKSAVSSSPNNKPSKLPQGRGISCSSKREATPPNSDSSDAEDAVEERGPWGQSKNKDVQRKKENAVLSFSDEKEVEGPAFKLKKCGDKAVMFQARRKEDPPDKDTHTTAADSPRKSPDHQASPDAHQQEEDDDDDEEDDVSTLSSSPSSPASDASTPKAVVIPDAKEIRAARRKRRDARAQKDFISLGKEGHGSPGSTPDRRSRDEDDDDDVEDEIGREDDDDDDDEPDDHERRIEFAPRPKSIRERIAEKLGGSNHSSSDSSEREEQELWEETQIEKGVKRLPGEQSPSGSDVSFSSTSTSGSRRARRRQMKKSKANLPESLPPVTISIVRRRITGKLESLRGVYRARQAELRRMEGDMESARSSLENLEDGSSERQLRFYRSMTLYTHNLVECLREKVVEINSLELELHAMLADQTEALLAHRRQTVREEAARMQQLSYPPEGQTGDSSDGDHNHSESGGEDSEDVPEDTQPSAEEQETLESKRADILSRSQVVFSDVQEDFCDVKKILCRFEDWRGAYSDSYHSAYISLCLPKLLNPIIRHQLLAWDPLQESSVDFEAFPWYSAVETFCHGQGYEESDHADTRTLPNAIEKTLLPKITAYVELVWDPLSVRQSVRLSDVCHRLREDYGIFQGERSKPVKALVEAVISRLRSSVDDDIFIPLYPKKFLEDRSSPQRRFRDQQFWTAVKLLGNMGKWAEVVPESTLKELMLDKLLSRYLMITLLNHPQPRHTVRTCRKIADSLPASWCEGASVCLSQLRSFSNHLVQVAHSICKQDSPPDPSTRAAVVEVLEVLRTIRAFDCITDIAEKYHYQDEVQSLQLLN